jgi:hypothetical protein
MRIRLQGLLGSVVLLTVLTWQFVPRPSGAAEGAAAVGGCSAGLCTGAVVALCGSVGDGCGNYMLCQNSTTGDYLCTPQPFCTAAGCHVVHGGTCY